MCMPCIAKTLHLTMPTISPISPLSPVSPMSPAKASAKPPHLMLYQHSTSLSGMEIAVPSPLTPGFRDYRTSCSKALPPTPRKTSLPYTPHSAPTSRKGSSAYSIPKEERPGTPKTPRKSPTMSTNFKEERPRTPRFALQDEALPSKTFLSPPDNRSSTSKIPDKVPLRPQLTRDAQTQGAPDFAARDQPSADSIFTEWKAPKYEYSDDEYNSSLPASGISSSHGSFAPSEHTPSAEERARDYTSVLPVFVAEPFDSEFGFLNTEMSARITNFSDGSLIPAPLVLSSNAEDRKLSSEFSSSESDDDSLYDKSKPSLKSRAKKAFHSRTQERREKAHADLNLSQHNRAGELAMAKHDSLQKGIDEMYNTLTGLYSPAKPKMKHSSATCESKAIAGDLRRPATSSTAHETSHKKDWDSGKSGKSPATKGDDSMGKKLANAFQNGAMAVGFDRGKEQRIKTEEWRSQMKRKIILVRPEN